MWKQHWVTHKQKRKTNERPDQDLTLRLPHSQHTMIWKIVATMRREQKDYLEKILQDPKGKISKSKESENPKENCLPTRWVGQDTNRPRSDMKKAISCKDLSEST